MQIQAKAYPHTATNAKKKYIEHDELRFATHQKKKVKRMSREEKNTYIHESKASQ